MTMAKQKSQAQQVPTTSSNWGQSVRAATEKEEEAPRKDIPVAEDGWDNQKLYQNPKDEGEFTAGELGLPDDEDEEELDGRGPLQQEGEGNRQNDQPFAGT